MAESTQKLNELLYSKLAENYPAIVTTKNNTQYQYPMDTAYARWGDGGTNDDWNAFEVGDLVSLNHGDTYTPDPQGSVNSRYRQWIQKIVFEPTTDNQDYRNYLAKKTNLQAQQTANLNQAYPAYEAWITTPIGKANKDTINTYVLWMKSPYGQSYGEKDAELQIEIGEVQSKLNQYINTSDETLKHVLQANDPVSTENPNFKDYVNPISPSPIVEGITSVVSEDGSNLLKDLGDWRNGANLKHFSCDLTTVEKPVHTLYTVTKVVYKHHSYFFGLFSSTTVSYEQFTKEITTYEHFGLSVNIGSVAYYLVQRTPWFNPDILQTYKDYKLTPPETSETYFDSETGQLALIPLGVLVGWNPTIIMTLDTSVYKKYQSQIESGDGIKIGPFLVGVGDNKPEVLDGPVEGSTRLRFSVPDDKLGTLEPIVLGYVNYATVV